MTATAELPDITTLTPEQRARFLGLLVKAELDSQPIPMPIFVQLDGTELGHFRPKWVPPEKSTPYPFTEDDLKEIDRRFRNPGRTFTYEEILALEASGRDASLLR
jgi:hypothetical protein